MIGGKVRNDLVIAFGAEGMFKAAGYVILALLARNLPREAFGEFLYLFALATLLVLLTDLGTSNYLVRETAQDRTRAPAQFVRVLRSRLPLLALFIAAMTAFAAATTPDLVWPAAGFAVFAAFKDLHRTSSSVLYGLRRVAPAQVVYGVALLLGVALVVVATQGGATLREVVLAYIAWGTFLFFTGLAFVRWYLGPLPWRRRTSSLSRLIRLSLPLFAVEVLALVHFKVDAIMLGLMRPMADVAAYEAGAKLLEASQFLVRPLTLIFFPLLAALAADPDRRPRLRRLFPRLLGLALALGSVLAAAVGVVAPWVIPLVFGEGFESSVPLLRILFLSVPGLYLGIVATFSGNALHIEKALIVVLFMAVALNIGLNAFVIPRFGPVGAAWSTVASQTCLAIGLVLLVWRGVVRAAESPPSDSRVQHAEVV